ncbi:hypothetical protein CL620_02260 [archaeon]|nr:hypothetical protein [archaeon]
MADERQPLEKITRDDPRARERVGGMFLAGGRGFGKSDDFMNSLYHHARLEMEGSTLAQANAYELGSSHTVFPLQDECGDIVTTYPVQLYRFV